MRNNLFIAFEGIDGSGKSTQVKLLADKLTAEGHRVYTTCEPTDGAIGSLLRSILKGQQEADHRTIAGLFLADRLDHLLNKPNGLVKKLEEGFTVITDRYYFSSYAYHSVHMPMQWVIAANSICAGILKPDLNVYIHVSPDVSMQRISANRGHTELYETAENLKQVSRAYAEAFEKLKSEEQIFITDGNRSPELIAVDVWNAVAKLVQSRKGA
jgi:dTMP kinase